MIQREEGAMQWLEFELLQDIAHLKHGVFLRHGGVSSGDFSTLNVRGNSEDDPACVQENRRRILTQFPNATWIAGYQVHGAHIEKIDGASPISPCDGLFTDKVGKALTILHADCQAAIFYDPKKNMIANVHSGWRGSVQNIYQETINLFKALGTNPSDLLVCISPSLGPNKAEFVHYQKELPESFIDFCVKDCFFDFWEITRMQLEKGGILPSHIEIAEICTYENKKDFFSYRRDKSAARHATVVSLL